MAPAKTTARMARLRAKLLRHEAGDDLDRAAILHQLAEQGAEQKQRKELRQEMRRRLP